ncbi:MAG: trimethylamine methyltransferase family protein, partial [Desulfobacterales bacterium]|nr:trimethylamine methyltransferase family protein [Desulfobacterales bacterium]
MYDRMQELSRAQMEKIHDAAMDLLKTTGVAFNDEEGLEIFKSNGFRVDGSTVFFEEAQIQKALETAPKRFTVHARNPEKSVEIGEDDFVFVPGYGAPFVMDSQGNQR